MKPKSSTTLTILLDTPDFVAINKPAGLATIPGRAETDSVLERLGRQLNLPSTGTADPRLRVVHRLDKETSGVLLFAKHTEAQRHLSHQFQNNTIEKEYLALIAGRPDSDHGDIKAPLAVHPTDKKRMAVVKHGGRPARTEWRVEKAFRGFALLRVFPKTGKTHQIRVHLKHIGLPLAIDPLYNRRATGVPDDLFLSSFKKDYRPPRGHYERALICRLTLHAEKLRVVGMNGEPIEVVAPLPKDFGATINQMSRHAV
ncbi:MAG TPA: RluA family pseudouridine synthase [Tepidisphaeraceae bacterium]|jgi:23S rRNA pseudouridine955/2504/2580 synthase/23S rRNA pseudouridine1911/1915/1917 synthase|nr:RluA family pseudouridine synthase [Tepidisphaeraceae bacterium]